MLKKRIVQVYKGPEDWLQGGIGLGDFLRGACHLYELTERLGMELRIDVSPTDFARYVQFDEDVFCVSEREQCRTAREHPSHTLVLREIMDFMVSDEKTLFIATNLGEWSREALPEEVKAFARRFLNFSDEVRTANSWAPRDYVVLHVRCGDDHFGTTERRLHRGNRAVLDLFVEQHLQNLDKPVLVMSDSQRAKRELARRYGFVEVPSLPSHGSSGKTFAPLVDIELLSRSSHNLSMNLRYEWWSGFAHYSSMVFDVPETHCFGPFAGGSIRRRIDFFARHPVRLLTV